MHRRAFLQTVAGASASLVVARGPRPAHAATLTVASTSFTEPRPER